MDKNPVSLLRPLNPLTSGEIFFNSPPVSEIHTGIFFIKFFRFLFEDKERVKILGKNSLNFLTRKGLRGHSLAFLKVRNFFAGMIP